MSIQVVGYSDKYVSAYRDRVAPWHKNVWNRIEEYFNTKVGSILIIAVVAVLFITAAVLNSTSIGQWCYGGAFLVVIIVAKIIPTLTKKPPLWRTVPLSEFMSTWPKSSFIPRFQEIVRHERSNNLEAEFMVEYLASKEVLNQKATPDTFVLWCYSHPAQDTKRFTRLVIERNHEYIEPPPTIYDVA